MTTEERLETLERELARGRWVNRGLVGALGLVVGVWVLAWAFAPGTARAQGANAAPKVIRAYAFVVEDEDGPLRRRLPSFVQPQPLCRIFSYIFFQERHISLEAAYQALPAF